MTDERTITLDRLDIGEIAVVGNIQNKNEIYRRLLDLGMIEGTLVECIGKSAAGDPSAYLVRGAVIAIRAKDAKEIEALRVGGEG